MKQTSRRPLTVVLAHRFVEQIFLTDRWDHLFREADPPLALLPREASPFCPPVTSWDDSQTTQGGKLKEVIFSVPETHEWVRVIMRGEQIDDAFAWYPHAVQLDIMVYDKELAKQYGERIVTPEYLVREKD